jgi:hypothetical protein
MNCLAGGKGVQLPFEGAPIETAAQLTVSDVPLARRGTTQTDDPRDRA